MHPPFALTKYNIHYTTHRCAHDRYSFGVGGHGRLNIGLYILFIEKWIEHFTPDQFLVVRLEDYALNPRAYMSTIFNFLGELLWFYG